MEEIPKFIRQHSKETNKLKRDELAITIKGIRGDAREETDKFDVRKKQENEKLETADKELEKKIQELKDLKLKIKGIEDSFLPQWVFYFSKKSLVKKESGVDYDARILRAQIQDLENQIVILDNSSKNKTSKGKKEAFRYLDDFYKNELYNWQYSEFSKEDISRYFNEEYLTSLSLEEYEILMQRFPSNMITHVTRQGVRDHIGMNEHSAGQGDFHNGFTNILEDKKRLISPLGVKIKEEEKTRSLTKYLENILDLDGKQQKYIQESSLVDVLGSSKVPTLESYRNEALNDLDKFLDGKLGGYHQNAYFDSSAIHFAAEQVADYFYGAESGNEIFFTFPGNFLASQYYFDYKNLVKDNNDLKWNDRWIWEKEERGISLDAGVVFIPGKTQVDKETGSKYMLDKNKNPILNQNYIDIANNFVGSDNFKEFSEKVLSAYNKRSANENEQIKSFMMELMNEFGILSEELREVLISYHFLNSHLIYKELKEKNGYDDPFHSCNYLTIEKLTEFSLLYIKSENTITSKEYWDNYFKMHPEQKPSKIVYYEESDPTIALNEWKKNNFMSRGADYGIPKAYSKEDEGYLGFKENLTSSPKNLLNERSSKFKPLAIKIINEYFEKIPVPTSQI